jgi:hypothetical protein
LPTSLLVRISSSPLWLLLVLVGLAGALHLVFVFAFPLKNVTWKYADYAWLLVAAIGGLAASAKSGQYIATNQLNLQGPWTNNSYNFLRSDIKVVKEIACMKRERSSFSPNNYDEIVKAQQFVCAQYEKLDSEMPVSVKAPFRPLAELGYHPITGDERYVKYEIERLASDATEYDQNVATYKDLVDRADSTDWETANAALGPLLLAFAIAIRITKTTGEIRNDRKKS